MANDIVTVWGGQLRLGRQPANNELLVGNSSGGFTLTPSSSILWSESVKTSADQTVTNSTTPVNATDMSFPVVSGVYYSFVFGLIFSIITTATSGGGVRVRFSIPSGTFVFGPGNTQTGSGGSFSGGGITNASIVIPASAVAGTNYYAFNILGTFNCTGNGTVQLQFAEATAAASTSTTLLKGSWTRYRTV